MQIFTHKSWLNYPRKDVFNWHQRPGALKRLMPPWLSFSLRGKDPGHLDIGREVCLATPLGFDFKARHTDYIEGRLFQDELVEGPFKSWVHTHTFEGEESCLYSDRIEWSLGRLDPLIRHRVSLELRRQFVFRHARLTRDLSLHTPRQPLSIAISGASGLVGSALVAFLKTGGHSVVTLVRRNPEEGEVYWNPLKGEIETKKLEGLDAVIHLAAETIQGYWNRSKKQKIKQSRIDGTRFLVDALGTLASPPKVFISASAMGYYGSSGGEVLNENTSSGSDFLAEVCTLWEAEAKRAQAYGMRVITPRLGIVLDASGGALKQMLPLFLAGLGGSIGSGQQYFSWISLDDVLGAFLHCMTKQNLEGPFNFSAGSLKQKNFAQILGRVLGRPTFLPTPELAIRGLMGEMGEALLLNSYRMDSSKLKDSGYCFLDPVLKEALEFTLGR